MRFAADPRTAGSKPNLSHASAASALAHAKSKPVEVWQPPTRQPAAEKAALCVKDLTPGQQQQPESTTQHSAEGLGAAMLAVREHRQSVGQESVPSIHRRGSSIDDRYHHTAVGGDPKDKALKAATGAYTLSRQRSDSAPSEPGLVYDSAHARSAGGALQGSRVEEEDHLGHLSPAMEASRIQHTANLNAKLYTSSPPGQTQTKEQNYRNSLRAAAISMAKDMYKITENREQPGQTGSAVVAAQRGQDQLGYRNTVSAVDGSAVRRAIALQDAAQKRAAEKLARMHDEQAEYQLYYGTAPQPQRSRLTSRRKRTSSDADSQIDAEQSQQIRTQMTSLRTKLDEVDVQRTRDRELLLQAARRNVDQTLQDMEAQIYADTGRAPPSVQKEWDEVAQERVRQEAEAFEGATQGDRVNIGGQKYMEMADVEAVARARLQPAFDEINESAELQRAQEVEARLDAEEEQRHAAVEREREAEVKELEKQERGNLPCLPRFKMFSDRRLGAEKRESKSEGRIPKFFLWRKKSKRARVEQSETEEAQAVSPVTQEPTEEQVPTASQEPAEEQVPVVASGHDPSTETIPDQSSYQTETGAETPVATAPSVPEIQIEEASTATPVAAIPSAPEPESPKPVENDVPVAIPRRPTRSQIEPLELDQQHAAATISAPANVHHFTPPVTSPRADAKLRTWFRDRLVRRTSGPVAVYPHQPGPDVNSDNEPTFKGGASLTGRDESRGAALSSHPLGGNDAIPTHNRSSSYYSNDNDVTKTYSQESTPESTKQNGNGKKWDRIRKTFLRPVSGSSEEPMSNSDSRRGSGNPTSNKEVRSPDPPNVQDTVNDQGLSVPPPTSDTMSTKRASRFSENL